MNLDELAQVGLNAPMPLPFAKTLEGRAHRSVIAAFDAGRKAATDHIVAAILRDAAEAPAHRLRALEAAARAVVARWDTPLWKDVEPTAQVINRLRDVLGPEQT